MENYHFFDKKEETLREAIMLKGTMTSTPVAILKKPVKSSQGYFHYMFGKLKEATAVSDEAWRINMSTEGAKMATLKRKFREKLELAKRLREKVGDPIALGRSIIEISNEKADEALSEHKGYKYVSKKS